MDKGQQWRQGVVQLGARTFTHAEYGDFAKTLPPASADPIWSHEDAVEHLARNKEALDEALRSPHEELVRHALENHLASTNSGSRHDYMDLAGQEALASAVRGGRPNPVKLYSGADWHPKDATVGYQSFSENKETAKYHAERRPNQQGRIYTAGPKSVRGIRPEDYGVESYGNEQEWIVDSASTKGLK